MLLHDLQHYTSRSVIRYYLRLLLSCRSFPCSAVKILHFIMLSVNKDVERWRDLRESRRGTFLRAKPRPNRFDRGEASFVLGIRQLFGYSFPMENCFLLNSFRILAARHPRPMQTCPAMWY